MLKSLLVMLVGVGSLACQGGPGANCGYDIPYYEPGVTYRVESSAETRKKAEEYKEDFASGRVAYRTYSALDALIKYASFRLKIAGKKAEADTLLKEWQKGHYADFLLRVGMDGRPIGDHAPLSTWLAEKYAMLEFILGEDILKWTRLSDIKVINFSIPIVFSCIDNVDEYEFSLHFIPFAGVTMYWTSLFSCVGFTWGSGFLFCSPISLGVEFATTKFVAPKLNKPIWNLSCN